ncbi:MAG: KEOPS complex subunit Cgi121 [Candidatus Thorarchaeota archaeon]
MLLENLVYAEETFKVGIAELKNKNELDQKSLLRMALEFSTDLLAFQLFNPLPIVGVGHLLSASQNALNAWKGGYGIARSLDVEVALYASGQHQIGVALESVGVRDGLESVALVMVAPEEEVLESQFHQVVERLGSEVLPPFSQTEERLRHVMEHFKISETELSIVSESDSLESRFKALTGCVESRISMVSLES